MFRRIKNFILVEKYPFLLERNRWTDKPIPDRYYFTELDSLPDGWRKRFGTLLCKDLQKVFKQTKFHNFVRNYRISEVKEKYGQLRWYDNGVPEDIYEEYNKIIKYYTKLSENTCVVCGKPGVIDWNTYWLQPLCTKHRLELNKM